MERRLALITGGTSGIGLGIAKALSKDFDLALVYHSNHERAGVVKRELSHAQGRVEVYGKTLLNYEDAKSLYAQVVSEFGRGPSVLVNSAGRIRDGLFLGSDFQQSQELIQEHLIVTMALCHLSIKDMYRNKFGRIINMSSISASYSKRGQANYAAAKAGIEGFTRTLALELAHRGVTVNAIAPGLIETPMTEGILQSFAEQKKSLGDRIPAGFAGKPADIGSYVQFLCSPEARYITGTVLTIDGGRSLGDPTS